MKNHFMQRAIKLSRQGMKNQEGGPFGCVIVKDGEIIAEGNNQVLKTHDATNHAEIMAIRQACKKLRTHELKDCELYTSCEPCPMCLGAIYWSHIGKVYYANTNEEAKKIGFNDAFFLAELRKPIQERSLLFEHLPSQEARAVFEEWEKKEDKQIY